MTDPFYTPDDAPSGNDYFNAKDHVNDKGQGDLLLFFVKEYRQDFENPFDKNGEKPLRDGVVVEVVILDGEKQDTKYGESQLHAGSLVKALKGSVGGAPVLGRLGKGAAQRGFQPPYVLANPTNEDKDVARAWLTANAPEPF